MQYILAYIVLLPVLLFLLLLLLDPRGRRRGRETYVLRKESSVLLVGI